VEKTSIHPSEVTFDFSSLVDKAVAETEIVTIRHQIKEQSMDELF
jgi:hypothetical protein